MTAEDRAVALADPVRAALTGDVAAVVTAQAPEVPAPWTVLRELRVTAVGRG